MDISEKRDTGRRLIIDDRIECPSQDLEPISEPENSELPNDDVGQPEKESSLEETPPLRKELSVETQGPPKPDIVEVSSQEAPAKVADPERTWRPFEYSSDKSPPKLTEILCAIEDARFMVALEGSSHNILISRHHMQKYYLKEMMEYLERFRKEPVPSDFDFRSSK